ncbi:MAG: hypothetical protein FGM24_09585 [Candidatus Kapabacteria bacterium]|nr:hypothetical protein [Candidatus Kapabacteria bacterium]
MKSFFEKLFAELPSYFSVFINALTSPSKLMDEIMTSQDGAEASARGIRFFILSEIIALVIAYAIPEWSASKIIPSTEHALAEVGSGIVLNVLVIILSCLVVIIAFRAVRHRADTKRFTALFTHIAGVAIVLTTLANSSTNIMKVDLEVARLYGESEVQMRQIEPHLGRVVNIQDSLEQGLPVNATDSVTLAILPKIKQIRANTSQISSKPTVMIVTLIVAMISLAIDVWMVFVGYLYAHRHGVSTLQYVLVVILAIVGIAVVTFAIESAVFGGQLQSSFTQ